MRGMELGELAIGGVSIGLLVPGLVELSKKLGLKGVWLIVLAFVLAGSFGSLWYALDAGLIPEAAEAWIHVGVMFLGCGVVGLAMCGYYDLTKRVAAGSSFRRMQSRDQGRGRS